MHGFNVPVKGLTGAHEKSKYYISHIVGIPSMKKDISSMQPVQEPQLRKRQSLRNVRVIGRYRPSYFTKKRTAQKERKKPKRLFDWKEWLYAP